MRAEHVKVWLWGVLEEEDPESQGNIAGNGGNWRLFVVATRTILTECRQGERKRGAVPHRWWWEQQMDLDVNDATGSDE